MKTQHLLVGTVIAGVAMFLMGGIVYGMLLRGFMSANCDNTNMRPPEEMMWGALIASNLVWGLLLSILLGSGPLTFVAGAKTGVLLGGLAGLGFDLSMHAMSTTFSNATVIIVDSIAFGLVLAVAGGLAALVMGRMKPKTA